MGNENAEEHKECTLLCQVRLVERGLRSDELSYSLRSSGCQENLFITEAHHARLGKNISFYGYFNYTCGIFVLRIGGIDVSRYGVPSCPHAPG